jgi:hypothetical protein
MYENHRRLVEDEIARWLPIVKALGLKHDRAIRLYRNYGVTTSAWECLLMCPSHHFAALRNLVAIGE